MGMISTGNTFLTRWRMGKNYGLSLRGSFLRNRICAVLRMGRGLHGLLGSMGDWRKPRFIRKQCRWDWAVVVKMGVILWERSKCLKLLGPLYLVQLLWLGRRSAARPILYGLLTSNVIVRKGLYAKGGPCQAPTASKPTLTATLPSSPLICAWSPLYPSTKIWAWGGVWQEGCAISGPKRSSLLSTGQF